MCGINGIASLSPIADGQLLIAMRDAMQHRGPDDAGVWCSADRRVGFGHRRLAIIDLSPAGHQPMTDAAGDLTITFNGEIYNFLELRHELLGRGHRFRSQSDTEVILAAYREWGEGMLDRLGGMFAFALHDARTGDVLMARDRAGEKPLYIRTFDGGIAFASELKALMADPSWERRVDRQALEIYLAYGYVPGAMCILQGVEKLPPASAMTFNVRTGARRTWRYWNLPDAPLAGAKVDAEELVHELEARLQTAVEHQMIADVPLGILLSGGLDSSLVTAMAARSGRRVKTFTVSFPGHGAYDESQYARIVAQHFGTEHVELPAEAANVSLLPQLARQYDEPMADSSMVPTYLVSRLIRSEATVALGGDGGDELFGGYPHYGWIAQQDRMRRWMPPPVRGVLHQAARTLLPLGLRGRNFILGLTAPRALRLAQANGYFDEASRRRLLSPIGRGSANGWPGPEAWKLAQIADAGSIMEQATRLDFTTYLPDDILVKVDRASMLTSLEVRAPMLDRQVLDFAFGRVPASLKADGGGRKILLRKLAARLLPQQLDLTRKQGFSIPLHTWFKGEWGTFMTEVLEDPQTPFDRRAVHALVAGQRRGFSNSNRIFALTMFELWRREYRVSL
jgi:asparagine synthase (glutamine-hydrolysing)